MKLYLYEENISGIDPYNVFAETRRLPREVEQPDENGDFFRYLGCAESESDVDSILYENDYAEKCNVQEMQQSDQRLVRKEN